MGRAGRKRRMNVVRTPSGRASRAHAAQQENAEPIATRMRLYGLSEADALDQKSATFVGRLQLRGQKLDGISTPQYDAATEYKRQCDAYRRAISAPDGLRNATRSGGERNDDDFAAWARAVKLKFEQSQAAVMREQSIIDNRGRNLIAALDYLVLRDEGHEHMTGDLRIALNALARHYGLAS